MLSSKSTGQTEDGGLLLGEFEICCHDLFIMGAGSIEWDV